MSYLKEESGFDRLLPKLIDRYVSLGRIGGSVKLSNLHPKEKEAFTLFFRKDYTHQSSATISFSLFEKALQKTKYAELDLKDILEAYAGKEIVTKQEENKQYEYEKMETFLRIQEAYPYAASWLDYIQMKGKGTRFFHSLYDEDKRRFVKTLESVCHALGQLPKESQYERLPVFAQRITKDPHAFDLDGEQGKAFLHALQYKWYEEGIISQITNHLTSEEANDLLQNFHLLRDDILNFVTCIGLVSQINQDESRMMKAANDEKAVLNLPLREVLKFTSCKPMYGNSVFVVENSGVCSTLLDRWSFPTPPPLICTNGQFKLAALLLIDLLAKGNVNIYYSGDFDPEGLQMAQRIYSRAPKHVKMWRYSIEDYEKCMSNMELSLERMAKLKMVDVNELQPVKGALWSNHRAGYQEELIEDLLTDMKKLCK